MGGSSRRCIDFVRHQWSAYNNYNNRHLVVRFSSHKHRNFRIRYRTSIRIKMEIIDILAKGWPMLLALITLIIVLSKLDLRVAVLEEKVKTLFELLNKKDK